ncbi:MAG: ABC transporter permease, partial [Gemmatimonadetes bacterium]|nr:ABC transporter permease [Gemmatimonadota bacterium]
MTGLWSDLSHMVRGLGRRPRAVFSITEAVLFRPLPLEDSHRLVSMHTAHPSRGMDRVSVSYPDFLEWRAEKDLIEAAAVFMPLDRDLSGEGDPERLRVAWVGAGFFETTRSKPLIGRTLVDGDQDLGAPTAVVISEGLWRRRFGSDPGTLGRDIRLDGIPYTVVGVLPETQGWPITAQAWIPLQFGSSPPAWADRRSNHTWQVIGRLRLGVGLNEAERRIAAVAEAGSALA